MGIFDDGFDAEDATILGGAMGFAEESMRAEEEGLNEEPEEEEFDFSELKEVDLRLIYNMNPDLFKHIVGLVRKQNAKWAADRMDREEVAEELKALEESEKMLEDLEKEYED